MSRVKDALPNVAVAVAAFFLFVWSFDLNTLFDQQFLFVPGVNLVFIPAGIKLLCLLVGGSAAAVGLFASSVYLSLEVWKNLPFVSIVYFGIISIATYAGAVYGVMRVFKVRHDLSNLNYWHIVALSACASLLNGFAHNVVYWTQGVTAADQFLTKSTAMAFGDFLGCCIVVMLFNAGINVVRAIRSR